MALTAFPNLSKTLRLADQTTYAYVHVPRSSKSTFLLLDGFPSSSYDWRHQIRSLTTAEYGVLAPDVLGYGDRDKPEELEAYRLKKMYGHLVEILGHEGVEGKILGVGHDWWGFEPSWFQSHAETSCIFFFREMFLVEQCLSQGCQQF